MSFHSLFFILLFLPLCVAFLNLFHERNGNVVILVFSLVFYYLSGELMVLLLLLSATLNYLAGRVIAQHRHRLFLAVMIIVNLLFLGFFKYRGFFEEITGTGPSQLGTGMVRALAIPLGISFFTFRAISYLVDIYRGKTGPCLNPATFLTWFSMFPLITAGPIVRYTELACQMEQRDAGIPNIVQGFRRFIKGLFKKVILAGTFAPIADRVFAARPEEISTGIAWIGALAFAFEIFFDFSGYTDMAIGTGRMLGFRFPENFHYPYQARNVRDFWQRWHMTLSSWLRDYLFLPLAYFISARLKKERYLNIRTDRIIYTAAIMVTFFTCGLWHGAGWTFITWGLWFAFFLALEQAGFRKLLKKGPVWIQHTYLMLVVVAGWVIFRSASMSSAVNYLGKMFSFSGGDPSVCSEIIFYTWNAETLLATVFALMLAFPMLPRIRSSVMRLPAFRNHEYLLIRTPVFILLGLLFVLCLSYIAATSHQPFLYKQF